MPISGDQPQHRAHGKLRLMHGNRIGYGAQHIDGALVHMRRDRADIVEAKPVFPHYGKQGVRGGVGMAARRVIRSEEHTSELQSLMRISYAVFCLKKKQKEN